MLQQEFSIGARVKINERSSAYAGRKGVIKFYSGGQYWVKLDDSDEIAPALHSWFLEPDR